MMDKTLFDERLTLARKWPRTPAETSRLLDIMNYEAYQLKCQIIANLSYRCVKDIESKKLQVVTDRTFEIIECAEEIARLTMNSLGMSREIVQQEHDRLVDK